MPRNITISQELAARPQQIAVPADTFLAIMASRSSFSKTQSTLIGVHSEGTLHLRRAACNTWFFWTIATKYSPAQGFFKVVESRHGDTILPTINRCILLTAYVIRRTEGHTEHDIVLSSDVSFVNPDFLWNTTTTTMYGRKPIIQMALCFLQIQLWLMILSQTSLMMFLKICSALNANAWWPWCKSLPKWW